MPRIKDFIKKNYVVCTVFAVVFIVCLASLIIIHLINTYRPHVDIKNETYGYFQVIGKNKKTFDADIRKENNVIKDIFPKKYTLMSLSPVYYENDDLLILPSESAIVLYAQGFKKYQLPKYSEVSYKEGSKLVIVNGKKQLANNSFIYDPNGNYIFLDEVTLKYNGKVVKLSPFSFINANVAGLTYYDYATKTIVDEDVEIKSATIVYDTFNINLLKNIVIKNGKVTMLKRGVDAFPVYKED